MWLTSFVGVELQRTATPHSLTVLSAFVASKVALVETNKTSSPASSITKLGIVKFSIPASPALPKEGARRAIKELPSFSSEERPRPTVQMPPLVDHHDPEEEVDDGFDDELDELDDEFDDEPPPAGPARERISTLPGVVPFPAAPRGSSPGIPIPASEDAEPIGLRAQAPEPPAAKPASDDGARRPARSWWHGALIGALMMTAAVCPFGLVAFV
jgi:hypothetical protein